jgi:hypothetical protein
MNIYQLIDALELEETWQILPDFCQKMSGFVYFVTDHSRSREENLKRFVLGYLMQSNVL